MLLMFNDVAQSITSERDHWLFEKPTLIGKEVQLIHQPEQLVSPVAVSLPNPSAFHPNISDSCFGIQAVR